MHIFGMGGQKAITTARHIQSASGDKKINTMLGMIRLERQHVLHGLNKRGASTNKRFVSREKKLYKRFMRKSRTEGGGSESSSLGVGMLLQESFSMGSGGKGRRK